MRSLCALLLRPEWRCAVLVVLVSSLLPIGPLLSQKPIRTPRVNTPPPRPDTITVESLPDGRILVKWTEVPVAKGYFLGRSRGNEGWRRIQVPMRGPGSNYYTDFDVHPGVRYRYQVATIDSADRVSLRINSDTIVGWQAYWGNSGVYQAAHKMSLVEGVRRSAAVGFPMQLGIDLYADPGDVMDYPQVMAEAERHQLGWLWWDFWNRWDSLGNNASLDGTAAQLTEAGRVVVQTDPNSIAHTARKACFR